MQITDTHLFEHPEGMLLGIPTLKSFSHVLKSIEESDLNFDAVIATGDISQDHTVTSYQHFISGISKLSLPCFWLPGNHDYKPSMFGALPSEPIHQCEHVLLGQHWQMIVLDSQVAGVPHGALSEAQLSLLDSALSKHPKRHSLILLHHHPYPAGSTWLDQHQLKDNEAFWDVLSTHDNVNGIVCGHIHQELDRVINGVRLMATPSTCVQFLPDSEGFALDSKTPGWRALTLLPNGNIDTEVHRLEQCDFIADHNANGY